MATSRIATQPRVSRSLKSAKIAKDVDPNDPMIVKARAFAETIRQLEFGRTLKNPVKLPVFNKEGTDFVPDAFPVRPKRAKPSERRKPSHRRQSGAAAPPELARHRRKCVVCNHPDREEIEEQFIHWRRPGNIAYDFDLEDDRYLHRHAQALGLYARRRENYLFTLENILKRGDEIELTAAAYIKAVRAYACMCDTVRWNEPAIRVIQEHNVRTLPDDQAAPSSSLPTAELNQPTPVSSAPSATRESRLAEQELSVALPSTLLPQAALDQPAPAAENNPHLQGAEEPVPITGIDTGASAPKGSAPAPLPASSFEPPASRTNRPSPRLETAVTRTKQRKEANPNRPQSAK